MPRAMPWRRAAGGFDRLLCYFDVGGLSHAETRASMELFAGKVLPALAGL